MEHHLVATAMVAIIVSKATNTTVPSLIAKDTAPTPPQIPKIAIPF